MFTGIIETSGVVEALESEGSNMHITLRSDISDELKIDQSLAHNGVCLTVVGLSDGTHTVTAVAETLKRSNLADLRMGDRVNLERAMTLSDRLDGHLVQGHVDQVGRCEKILEHNGSWEFFFSFSPSPDQLIVEKGSICVDGVSLTVVHSGSSDFSVAIIPYTYEHTRFGDYKVGTKVNLEFDIIGKYVARKLDSRK